MTPDAQPPIAEKGRRTSVRLRLTVLALTSGIAAGVTLLMWQPLADQPEKARPAKSTDPPGTFRPTQLQWRGLKLATVTPMTFRPEQITEGNIAVDDDLTTPVFSHYSGRLAEIVLLSKRAQKMVGSAAIFTALSPFATRTIAHQSEVIIRKGDLSDCLYLVYEGLLWVAEAGAELGPGSVIGEMGVLSRTHARTATVRAHTDCVLGCVSAQDFDRVFRQPTRG